MEFSERAYCESFGFAVLFSSEFPHLQAILAGITSPFPQLLELGNGGGFATYFTYILPQQK